MNRPPVARGLIVGAMLMGATLTPAAWGAELPQYAPDKHMGVATCASTVCHGQVLENVDGTVGQDEYRTWARHDRHARAYQILLNDESREIARKLGLENAHEADLCLDCHADNVSADKRGTRFHLNDGVGCEACHGGSERWLISHAAEGATHADNLAAGMFPTDDLRARAELCLSCHQGTQDKFATHRIMGAGHPRLLFELDTFTIRAPEHYRVDQDYRQRKHDETATSRWAVGALVTARRYAELLQGKLFTDHPLYPEIGLFDCHSCHAPFNDFGWQTQPATAPLGPGQVRLNDSSLLIASVALSQLDSSLGSRLYTLITALHEASGKDRQAVGDVSGRIVELLNSAEPTAMTASLPLNKLRAARTGLLELGERGEFQDYAGAEQAVMSIDVLSFAIEDPATELKSSLDRMYQVVDNDDGYVPSSLVEEFRTFRSLAAASR